MTLMVNYTTTTTTTVMSLSCVCVFVFVFVFVYCCCIRLTDSCDMFINTLRTGDADLRFYITTVQDG